MVMPCLSVGLSSHELPSMLCLDSSLISIDFTAVWCGPCRVISPVFDELAAKHTNALFVKVDVDKHAQVAQECNISAMPTFKVSCAQVTVISSHRDWFCVARPSRMVCLLVRWWALTRTS